MATQTAWSETGFFDRQKFDATLETPNSPPDDDVEESENDDDPTVIFSFDRSENYKRKHSLLELIVPHGVMSREIQQRLRKFVSKPLPPTVGVVESPPDSVEMPTQTWNEDTNSYDRGTESVPMVRREMEHAASHDLMAVLRLVDAGKVGITEKNRWPTPAAIRQVAEVLDGADYYPEDPSDLNVVATGPLSSADVLLLDTFADRTGDRIWRLDPARFLDAEAAGRSAEELIAFLEAASGEDVPEPVGRFIADLATRSRALTDLGPARLIGCADPALAAFIANHPATAKACSLAGADQLVVPARHATTFHRALRKLGFVLRSPAADR